MNNRKIAKRDLLGATPLMRPSVQRETFSIPNRLEIGRSYSDEPLDVRAIVEKLLKKKVQILVVTLLVLIPAAIANYLTTPLYRSFAVLQFNPEGTQVLPYRDVAEYGGGASSYDSALMTQEQILRSPTLVDRVAERLKLEARNGTPGLERYLLKQQFDIRRIQASQLFQVSWLAPHPQLAANVVNLFVEEYVKQYYEFRQANREKVRQSLKKELNDLEKRIQVSESQLVRYAKDNNIMNLDPGQGEPVQKKLTILDDQIAGVEADLATARSRQESIQKSSAKDFPERFVTPVIQGLTTNYLQLEHELTALRTKYGENWPDVVQKRNELDLVRRQLEQEKSAVLDQAREQARLDLQAVKTRHRIMSTSMAEQKKLVNRYHNASIEYNILRREVETNKKLYEGLLERLKQTGVMAGFEFGSIQVLESARPDPKVDTPKIWWNLSLASLLGLALGVCFAFVLDFWDNSISTLEEVEQLAALPGLGVVPLIKSSESLRMLQMDGGKQANRSSTEMSLLNSSSVSLTQYASSPPEIAEAVRGICASILLSRSDRVPQVIVVTSSVPAEGKTTLVSQLGRAFADGGSKTLMVEADFRRPDLSKSFGAGSENGLSLFLSGLAPSLPLATPLPKINKTDNPNLFLVTAGPKAPNPIALFNSERMDLFLKKMTSSFQFILIDAPPLLAVADALVLSSKADGVVLVVRAGRTAKNLVLRASALLDHAGINLLGTVLNGAEHSASYGSYYYHYQSYEST